MNEEFASASPASELHTVINQAGHRVDQIFGNETTRRGLGSRLKKAVVHHDSIAHPLSDHHHGRRGGLDGGRWCVRRSALRREAGDRSAEQKQSAQDGVAEDSAAEVIRFVLHDAANEQRTCQASDL